MAILSYADIQRYLRQPQNGAALAACQAQEQRIRLHADAHVDPATQPPGLSTLLALPKAILPADKYEKFCAFLPSPLPTVKFVGKVADGLSRVFEAQDGSVTLTLATPELETDFETYRAARHEEAFWPGTAFQAVIRALHSVLVVDMAAEQTTPRPEPYVFTLDIFDVHDIAIKVDSSCEYLLFRLPARLDAQDREVLRMAVYDDGHYRIFEKAPDAPDWAAEPVLENAHVLGYCPARLLWSESLGSKTSLLRKGPLTNELAELDRYVYWHCSIEYFKSYGMFPMLWSVEEECQYKTPEGENCQGGVINTLVGYWTPELDAEPVPRYKAMPCPSCAKSNYIGPGTHLKVPAPTKDTGDTREPLGFVTTDVAALTDARTSLSEMAEGILDSCLGIGGEQSNDAAKNAKQVRAGFENKQDVLQRVANNLDKARAWVLASWGTLRYGSLFQRAVVTSGEQFYLKTPEELSEAESAARKAGRPVFELSQAREMRYYTQYRNNPPLLDRMRILSDLEPYPEYSLDQITTMVAGSLNQGASYLLTVFDPKLLQLKADFARYLARFESEQTDVRTFGALLPYHLKIARISTILLSYVSVSQTS